VARVAAGGADLCLTSLAHYLRARAANPQVAARFVAPVVRRTPMAGLVAADSPMTVPADLSGRRLGGPADSRLVAEYQACLAHLGLALSVLVPTNYGAAPAALGRGEVDIVPDFVDLIPRTRRQAGVPIRAVPFGFELYSSGLVAADRVPLDLVLRVVEAVTEALERQREDPKAGLAELARRYPEADPADALEGWSLVEPNVFTGPPPGVSDLATWRTSVELTSRALDLPAPPAESVVRTETVGPTKEVT
jgi:ABC-type nitrate/sulfonate/bicarbonate transport system substrate-binding protein